MTLFIILLFAWLIILLIDRRTLRKTQAERKATKEIRECIERLRKSMETMNNLAYNHKQKQLYNFRLLVKKFRRETGESWKDGI